MMKISKIETSINNSKDNTQTFYRQPRMRWNWNVWSLKLPLIWTKRIWSHYLDSMLSSLTILFHHSLLSSVQIDHIICDYQYFRPKTHIIYHSCRVAVRWHGMDVESKIRPRQTLIVVDLESYPKGETLRGSSSNSLKRFSYARRKSTSCYNLVYVCPFCPWQSYEIGAIGLIINYIHLFGTLRNIRITWRK